MTKEERMKEQVLQELADKLAYKALENPKLLQQIKDIGISLGLPIEEILNKEPDENTFSF